MKVALFFEHYGPYHLARAEASQQTATAEELVSIVPVELFGDCQTYDWRREVTSSSSIQTVIPEDSAQETAKSRLRVQVEKSLGQLNPDVIAIHGWSLPGTAAAMNWACKNDARVVVMSESRAIDSPRSKAKEFLKRQILNNVDAGLVGSPSHRQYLVDLGLPAESVFFGYDAIDNDYFQTGAEQIRSDRQSREQLNRLVPIGDAEQFFFASCRFVEKKNLQRLIDSYAAYRQNASNPWDLVLAGDGDLKAALVDQIVGLGLTENVHLPGFIQYDQLPLFYGLASAFIHVSTVEQWGLVVNEAAASGLPLIVSRQTGSSECLLAGGKNGFVVDAFAGDSIAEAMMRMTSLSKENREAMGTESQRIVAGFGPRQFADGLLGAASYAQANPRKRTMLSRAVLGLMARFG